MEIRGQCPAHSADTNGSDSYFWNSEKGVGNCKSCNLHTWTTEEGDLWGRYGKHGKPFPIDNEQDNMKQEDWHSEAVIEAPKEDTWAYVPMRGITKDTMEFFGVKTFGNKQMYVYPSGGVKTRYLDNKSFSAANGFKGDELFGMNLFPAGCSKKLTVVEGELDALSAYQMLKGSYLNPVVSLPGANPSGKLWEKCKKYLDSFEEIILSVDNDDPGRKVAETMFDMFQDKVFVVNHGDFKDANDFLQAGQAQVYKSAWWKAKKYTPAGFTVGIDAWKKAVLEQNPYEYVPTHIEAYNKGGRGWIKGGTTILKAPPGTGKTSLFRGIQHDLVMRKDQKVAVLHMEEVDGLTGRGMATYELGVNVNTKEDQQNNGISDETLVEAVEKVVGEDKFMTFTIDPTDPIESCLRQAKYAASAFNVDYIFIDHLQKLAYMAGTKNATEELTSLIVNLNELCVRKGVGIICISHINEDGKAKYAKSIEEEAYVVVDMVRDKKAEDAQERNTTYLSIDKNRPFAYTGDAGALEYDVDTTIVRERKGPQEPKVERRDDF